MRDPTQARLSLLFPRPRLLHWQERREEQVQAAFWYQGRKSLWKEVVCRGDAFCSAGKKCLCTVTPNHCHLRVIVMGTWEVGSPGKPHLGLCVLSGHPEAWLGVPLMDTGLGAVALQISTLYSSWFPLLVSQPKLVASSVPFWG